METTSPLGRRLTYALAVAGSIVLLSLMVLTLANVIARGLFNTPIPNTNEIAAYWMLPGIAFIGFIVAEAKNEHIEARIIYDRFKNPNKKEFEVLTSGIAGLVVLGLAYFGFTEGMHAMEIGRTAGVSPIPVGPVEMFISICMFIFAIQLLVRSVRAARTPADQFTKGETLDELAHEIPEV